MPRPIEPMKILLQDVLKKIQPSLHEIAEAHDLFNEIKDFIKVRYELDAKLMGSVAKDTFLSGDRDLDIFVFFPTSYSKQRLEKEALEIGKAVFDKFKGATYEVSYAEHPYTRGKIRNFKVEIVPAYSIENTSQLLSAVDRTPFHTQYVREHLFQNNDVRLLKKFMKGIGAYGSDLKTRGFSGYLCELLVIKHSSFENVLRASKEWVDGQVIHTNADFTEKEQKQIRTAFPQQPLIFIDPTDEQRNVAAVLSAEKMALFMYHARKFLQSQDKKFFFPPEQKVNKTKLHSDLKKKGRDVVVILFKHPGKIEDILYPQLRKMKETVISQLKAEEFVVERIFEFADAKTKECGLSIELASDQLSSSRVVRGPSVFNPVDHQDNFVQKHTHAWFEGFILRAETKRQYVTIDSLLKSLLSGKATDLHNRGIPSYLAESIAKGYKLVKISGMKSIKTDEFWKQIERKQLLA
jgi:tRNA nucleotidyltransferase (CCA-adding enzyme)